jgi:hypothetical protein
MAFYPASVADFGTDRVDGSSPVIASDVNALYAEVKAIETYVGLNPTISEWTGSSFTTATTDWGSVHARIKNIEKGVSTVFNDRVSKAGGTTISSSGTTVGLTVTTSGSGNLINLAGNTVVNSTGYIVTIDGGTA